jgi:hypothetical protein
MRRLGLEEAPVAKYVGVGRRTAILVEKWVEVLTGLSEEWWRGREGRTPTEADEAAVEPGGWINVFDQDPSCREAIDPPVRPAADVLAMTGGQQLHAEGVRDEPVLIRVAIAKQGVHVRDV